MASFGNYRLECSIRAVFKLNHYCRSVLIDFVKRVRLRSETEISCWSWPRREHLGWAVEQLLRLWLAFLKALGQIFSQAELGRRPIASLQKVIKAQLVSSQTWVIYLLKSSSIINSAIRKFAGHKYCVLYIYSIWTLWRSLTDWFRNYDIITLWLKYTYIG